LTILEAITALGHTCLDRKISDLFWWKSPQETAPKLVVIDWNIVQDNRLENQHAQLMRFAQLWYEITTGYTPRPPFLPFEDKNWQAAFQTQNSIAKTIGAISVGFRLILQTVLSATPDTTATALQRIKQHCGSWLDLLSNKRFVALRDVFSPTDYTDEELRAIEDDLKTRQNFVPDSLQARQESMTHARGKLESQFQHISDYLVSGDYNAAENLLQELAAQYPTEARVRRWHCLLQALIDDNYAGSDQLRRERGALVTDVHILNTIYSPESLAGVHHHLYSCLHSIETVPSVIENLNLLIQETAFLLKLERYKTLLHYDSALTRLQLARELIQEYQQGAWDFPLEWPQLQYDQYFLSDENSALMSTIDFQAEKSRFIAALTYRLHENYLKPRRDIELAQDSARLIERLRQAQLTDIEEATLHLVTEAKDALRYLRWLETSPPLPDAIRYLTDLKDSPFYDTLNVAQDIYERQILEHLKNLGTPDEPRWIQYADYQNTLRPVVDKIQLDYLKSKLSFFISKDQAFNEAYLQRAEQIREFCDREIPQFLGENQRHEALPKLIERILKVKINLSGEQDFERIVGELASMFAEWRNVLSNIENQIHEHQQQLHVQQTSIDGLVEGLETRIDGLNQEIERFKSLQAIWSAIAVMDYDQARHQIEQAKAAHLLLTEDVEKIDAALIDFRRYNIQALDVKRMYETLVTRGQSLLVEDRLQLRQLAADLRKDYRPSVPVDRLLDMDIVLTMQNAAKQRFDIYRVIVDENSQFFAEMRAVIELFLNLSQQGTHPQFTSHLTQLETRLDAIKPTVNMGGILFLDSFMHWYNLLYAIRKGVMVIDNPHAQAYPEQRLDTLVELSQSLPEIAFHMLYPRWEYAFDNALPALQPLYKDRKGERWSSFVQQTEAYKRQAYERATLGGRLLHKYRVLLNAAGEGEHG
jgi:hypothetical protein